MGKFKNFKFSGEVDYSKCKPTDDRL